MARKSRKQIAVEDPVIESVSSEVFSTAIYARLSVENSGKSEKVDVIANQIEICKSYIAERPYLNLIDTYVDNGRTGTVFDRPEFNRLMNDIRTGRIKCLVVRDLSRFGRDYIEAGTYLERVFPQIGLRFIAIKENYDNFDADGSGESLIIPLQNMINTLYSKDISRKVSTALKAQMESGDFKKRNLPYGYRWDEEHSNMVFDEETAPIVRKIFQWKIEGLQNPSGCPMLHFLSIQRNLSGSRNSHTVAAVCRFRYTGFQYNAPSGSIHYGKKPSIRLPVWSQC